MDKRAFFVIGPESSGTRMMTKALLLASDGYGDAGHGQRMDGSSFENLPDVIVFRRSLPHARKWPDVCEIISRMQSAGYKVIVIAMCRNIDVLVRSQLKHHHVESRHQALGNIDQANGIIESIESVDVNYGEFVTNRNARAALFTRLGLNVPNMQFYDGNEKYKVSL